MMSVSQVKQVLKVLVAAFPKQPPLEAETVGLYATAIGRFDLDIAMAAAARMAQECETFPSVRTVTAHCQAELRRVSTYTRQPELAAARRDEIGKAGVRRARLALAAGLEGKGDRFPDLSPDADAPKPGEWNAAGPQGDGEPEQALAG